MLEVDSAVKAARRLTGLRVADPDNSGADIFAIKFLSNTSELVALEHDDGRHVEQFLTAFDEFIQALKDFSLDGAGQEQQNIIESQCKFDISSNIMERARIELQTLVDDLESQLHGSTDEVDSKGTGFDTPKPPKEPKRNSPNSGHGWRDSINPRDDDEFEQSGSDWRESLGRDDFDTSGNEPWKESAGDDFLRDLRITGEAMTDFDRETSGDYMGFHRSIDEKLKRAKAYLAEFQKVATAFNGDFRAALGCHA